MRNLFLQAELKWNFVLSTYGIDDTSTIVDLCHLGTISRSNDSTAPYEEDGSIVVLTRNGTLIRLQQTEDDIISIIWSCRLDDICTTGDEEINSSDNNNGGSWFDLMYVNNSSSANSSNMIVCLNYNGAIVSVQPETGDGQLVGMFENGIDAACWSPDREVLLLVTAAAVDHEEVSGGSLRSVLLTMNTNWDVLAEVNLENHIRDPKTNNNGSKVSIAWRPDGTLCAVSSVDCSDSMRKIRIFKRSTLDLFAIGRNEDAKGMLVPDIQSTTISWAGSGCSQLLAAIQRKGIKTLQVAFFEPNGLRHNQFVLRCSSSATVIDLAWNAYSDILAVALHEETYNGVQLWSRSNYHWYLKQELRFQDRQVTRIKFFSDSRPYSLSVMFDSSLMWNDYQFRWDCSSIDASAHGCSAFVIDGCQLNITPLDQSIVPPPMFASSLQFEAPISELSFVHSPRSSVCCLVALSNSEMVVLNSLQKSVNTIQDWSSPTILAIAQWKVDTMISEIDFSTLRRLVIVVAEENLLRVVAVASSPTNQSIERLVSIFITWDKDLAGTISVIGVLPTLSRVISMVPWADCLEGSFMQLENGSLMEFEVEETGPGILRPSAAEPLLEPCPWIEAIKNPQKLTGKSEHNERKRLVVGMSSRSRLYYHELLLADSVSSFILSMYQQYVVYCTAGSKCQMRFLSLAELHDFDPLVGSDENALLQGYEPRNIERDGRLVAILPQKPTAILQMPRGNLEVVYPRALVLRYVVLRIMERRYKDAFAVMRRQKVDLNLIVDIDPLYFLDDSKGVHTLIEQIDDCDRLNLFISSLHNWDSTEDRYRIPLWLDQSHDHISSTLIGLKPAFDFSSKVNRVCASLRQTMLTYENVGATASGRPIAHGYFLLPILSTFAKEDPPLIEEALQLIRDRAFNAHQSSKQHKQPLFSDGTQSAIQYLAFLADYQLLFDRALGIYDFDMARAIARNSQMDPRVYLPLLKRLQAIPVHYAHFEVDMRLKKYESALRNLWKSAAEGETISAVPSSDVTYENDYDSCMRLIVEHSLYRVGLELFQAETMRHRILIALGDHFMENKQWSQALNVFMTASPINQERAMYAARLCKDWTTFFRLAGILVDEQHQMDETSHENRQKLVREVANELATGANGSLQIRQRYTDAARILLDYSNDVAGAVDILLRADHWAEGQRIAVLHSRGDLEKKCVDGAIAFAKASINDLLERQTMFLSTLARYIEVRKILVTAMSASEIDGPVDAEGDNGSLFSVTSDVSNFSMRSGFSTTSAGSLSSVISVKSNSSFRIAGDSDSSRHKSKFNEIGRQNKSKKKRAKGRTKVRPGSEQELIGLAETLVNHCPDVTFAVLVGDAVTFLMRNSHLTLACSLYDQYMSTYHSIETCLEQRRQLELEQPPQAEFRNTQQRAPLPIEITLNTLACAPLPETIHVVFSYLGGLV